jgi:hypothetical protein
MIKSKKGQIGLADAPQIVMIVGFVFLIMATIAFVASEYGTAIPSDELNTVVNETVTQAERNLGAVLAGGATNCNPETFVITNVTNGTGNLQVLASNYTLNTVTGAFQNTSGLWGASPDWRVSYTYYDSKTACDITQDLNTELSDNTSIAGIVLTISLIGIVLSVLVGVFVLARRGGM